MREGRRQGERRARVEASRQYAGGRFRNTHGVGPSLHGNPLSLLSEYALGKAERVPRGRLPVHDPREGWARPVETGLRVTWLGHSTVLVELDGARILTDPVWGERASPSAFAGPRRFHAVPVTIRDLPRPDVVLLSHDHYDHLCRASVVELAQRGVPIVTSLGVGAHLEAFGVPAHLVHELDWHESHEVAGVRITATPAQHFSGRGLTDRNATLWSSWVVAGARHKLFFSGDTGLTDEFAAIGAAHGPFDLVMLEVGAFHEAWSDVHLGPANALEALRMLGGGPLLPVHWGTFNLALHAWDEPAETLVQLARSEPIITPRLGSVVEPERVDTPDPWWRGV
jgi:L-ascorbate metabolism protein UlaG (beta-lactamase superfamily)